MTTKEALKIIETLDIQNKNDWMVTMNDIASLVRAMDHINGIYSNVMNQSKSGEAS